MDPGHKARDDTLAAAASRAGEMAGADEMPARAADDGVGNDRADDGHDDADDDLRRPIPHAASLARARQASDPPQDLIHLEGGIGTSWDEAPESAYCTAGALRRGPPSVS